MVIFRKGEAKGVRPLASVCKFQLCEEKLAWVD